MHGEQAGKTCFGNGYGPTSTAMHSASRIPRGHPIQTVVAMREATELAMLNMVKNVSKRSPVAT